MTDPPEFEPQEQVPNPSYSQVMLDTKGLPAPADGESVWRHPLFVLLVGALVVMAFALICVTFALITVNNTKNDVQNQLSCSRQFTTATADAQANVLAANGRGNALTLDALLTISQGDEAAAEVAVQKIPAVIADMQDTSTALEEAIEAQRASLQICT